DIARRQHAVCDRLLEDGLGRIGGVEMHGIAVARHLGKACHISRRHRLGKARFHAKFKIFEEIALPRDDVKVCAYFTAPCAAETLIIYKLRRNTPATANMGNAGSQEKIVASLRTYGHRRRPRRSPAGGLLRCSDGALRTSVARDAVAVARG